MPQRLEVFADITCPFTHVGLRKVVDILQGVDVDIDIIVRAWPLEWVNGAMLEADAVEGKINALRTQLGIDAFTGFDPATWPTTTLPALNLASAAYEVDAATGLQVSLAVRDALFEHGLDVSDPAVLADLATNYGLATPAEGANPPVKADYADGQDRGVKGSPDFWLGEDEFFCPALTLGHDDQGLTADFDAAGLESFIARIQKLA